MASTSETGHAKNVANLQRLIERVVVYSKYNPPVDKLKIENLRTLHTAAKDKLAAVEDSRAAVKNSKSWRQISFERLKSLSTRIVNHLDILGLPQGTVEHAKSINRQIQGGQSKGSAAKKTPPPTTEKTDDTTPVGEDSGSISTSRQSYSQLADNFGILIKLLETIPNYAPNEEDLTLPNLKLYEDALVASTISVDTMEGDLNNKLIERDQLLYTRFDGLYSIAQDVKKYVKSVYGATAPEYTSIAGIEFTNRK